jgi:hypothetical protein
MCNGGVGISNIESECYFVFWDQSVDQTIERWKNFTTHLCMIYMTNVYYQVKVSALKLLKATIVRLNAIH